MIVGSSLGGKLLVSTPALGDPNFDRTVVYLLEAGDQGAVGLVLNRPTDDARGTAVQLAELGLIEVPQVLMVWFERATPPPMVFTGGPVELDALIALGEAERPNPAAFGSLRGAIGTIDLSADPDDVAERLERIRIFRGYSGWAPGQLEGEIAAGAWIVVDALADDIFTEQPKELWRVVLRRQGGQLAWIAEAPGDIAWN